MFGNYLKMAWRVLGRRKFFTFISLFGIGFTLTALMLVVAVTDHYLAPGYPEVNLGRTLTLTRLSMAGENMTWNSGVGYKFAHTYGRDLPGVERMSVYTGGSTATVFREGRKLEFMVRYVDPEYWKVMAFSFLEGGAITAEDNAAARQVAVISEATRKRLFGDEPALGRDVEILGRALRVVGVVENVARYRLATSGDIWLNMGAHPSPSFYDQLLGECEVAYLLEEGADRTAMRAAFAERLTRVEFPDPENFDTMRGDPMTAFETMSRLIIPSQEESAPRRLLLLAGGGMLLFMLLPAINLVNINLSRIYERSSEIGVRKAFGAASGDLVLQFVVENVVLCIIGGLIGLLGASALLKAVEFIPRLPFMPFSLNWRIFLSALVLATIFGLISGVWPAWKMSRSHPVTALKGGTS